MKAKSRSNADKSFRSIDVPPPVTRPLKVYAFDPSQGGYMGNQMTLDVKYEKLLPGPTGRRIAVIDYDGANRVFYKPVDLDDPNLLIRGGIDPSESDPRFHQQMVYAVVSETIQHFEAALGRRIRWRLDERLPDAQGKMPKGAMPGDIFRLNPPSAMIAANAAYSPSAKAILLVISEPAKRPGRNLPGRRCLRVSYDIIVHETTHAVLTAYDLLCGATNPEVPAFHEAFADLAALFRHSLTKRRCSIPFRRLAAGYTTPFRPDAALADDVCVQIQTQLAQSNPLIDLARQFGEARGSGKAPFGWASTKPRSDQEPES
jgi:hypothetical protein